MTQEDLIKKCCKGNRTAQEELYRRYSPVLYGLCLKYSRNKNEAEDNLHDSFVTIFQKMHQYGFKGSFEGWIKRITINTVLQKYRKEEPLALMTELPDPVEEVYSEEETEVSLSTLLKYIQELPTKYRITFNLYVLDGYSHKEISEALGTSQGTSKSNLARARMILQEKILKKKQIA
ncbi:RNA polymerase sigma factor [Robiginitalea marina]|uniref:RNA polymerase sigma factor n=1 Tax=Robiginitalea marina TaxID=2954105 RepID=A0ABT1AYI8_9FLAO|nr:RNA polymerase sigma factor [Robiginitalea marina]MCO5724273.1 RNA polymerase sigma factor [Robiginitalea marina]